MFRWTGKLCEFADKAEEGPYRPRPAALEELDEAVEKILAGLDK